MGSLMRSTKMNHKIGIVIGLVILALVALYKFLEERHTVYTSEATVVLLRDEPTPDKEVKEKNEVEDSELTEESVMESARIIQGIEKTLNDRSDSRIIKEVEPAGTGQPM